MEPKTGSVISITFAIAIAVASLVLASLSFVQARRNALTIEALTYNFNALEDESLPSSTCPILHWAGNYTGEVVISKVVEAGGVVSDKFPDGFNFTAWIDCGFGGKRGSYMYNYPGENGTELGTMCLDLGTKWPGTQLNCLDVKEPAKYQFHPISFDETDCTVKDVRVLYSEYASADGNPNCQDGVDCRTTIAIFNVHRVPGDVIECTN